MSATGGDRNVILALFSHITQQRGKSFRSEKWIVSDEARKPTVIIKVPVHYLYDIEIGLKRNDLEGGQYFTNYFYL